MRAFRPLLALVSLLLAMPAEAAPRASGCVSVAIDIAETSSSQSGQISRHKAGQYQQNEVKQCYSGDPLKMSTIATVDISLAASGTQNIDLAGSVAARLAANGTLSFTKVRGWCLFEYDDLGALSILPGASNPFALGLTGTTPAIATRGNGGFICNVIGGALTGDTVTAATGDILTVSCATGACTGRFVVWGI